MKHLFRILILISLIGIALPLATINAQDDLPPIPEEDLIVSALAVYYQSANSGEFVDNGDDTYTLTLNAADPQITIINTALPLSVSQLDTFGFMTNWAAAGDISVEATLQVDDLNIRLILSQPTYDLETLTQTFVATVVEVVSLAGAEGTLPKKGFTLATLAFAPAEDFLTAYAVALETEDLGGVRDDDLPPGCVLRYCLRPDPDNPGSMESYPCAQSCIDCAAYAAQIQAKRDFIVIAQANIDAWQSGCSVPGGLYPLLGGPQACSMVWQWTIMRDSAQNDLNSLLSIYNFYECQ
ncbi:MAG: hypothetical protein JXA10_15965 [Anaerolineae bacterium]|nr:hypothetical protein [Anaerolineae bacterium]